MPDRIVSQACLSYSTQLPESILVPEFLNYGLYESWGRRAACGLPEKTPVFSIWISITASH